MVVNQFKALAKCEQCTLNGRPCLGQAVPQEHRPIVVVSQAPIMADVLANDAFDSRGGQLVRLTLENLGFSRDQWMGTYAVLCTPVDGQQPTMLELSACRDRLIAQVKSVRPKVIMVLGEVALRAMSRTNAGRLSTRRGMPYWDAELQAYVIFTHHPRYAMEQPSAFHEFAADFQKIPSVLNWAPGKEVKPPDVTHYVITDEDKAIMAIEHMRRDFNHIYTDIETKGFNFKKHQIICQGFSWQPDLAIIFDKNIIHSQKVYPYWKALMEDDNIEWEWHNGKFDIKFLHWQHGIKARVDQDTMLKHYVINERRGTHDLEQVAVELLYVEPWEHEINKYKAMPGFQDYEDIPKPVLHKYLARDVGYGMGVSRVLDEMLDAERAKGRNVDLLYKKLLIGGANAYAKIEIAGMPADKEYTAELKEHFEPLLEQRLDDMNQMALEFGFDVQEYCTWWTQIAMDKWNKEGRRKGKKPPNPTKPPKPTNGRIFNPNSHQQLKYVMYHLLKLPLYKKKEMSADKDARKWYLDNIDDERVQRFISTLDAFKKDSKAYSTYVLGLDQLVWEEDGKIHSTFNLHGTETGRLSSSDPNVHNIPRDSMIKNIFVAEPDDEYSEEFGEWVILQADYSQAELRVLAVLGGSPWLKQIYTDGRDLHDEVSIELYGPDFTKEQRVRAKAVNFGIPYGRTEYTLAQEFKISIKEAREMILKWFRPQPETKAFMDARRNEPLQGIVYTTPTGRQRFYGLITEDNKRAIMNEAGNFPIQSTASDCTLLSTITIVNTLETMHVKRGNKEIPIAYVMNSVHDSIITQVRANFLPQIAELKKKVMTSVPKDLINADIPFEADFEIGYRWGSLCSYDYQSQTVSWEAKQEDGSKKKVKCSLDTFRKFRGDTKKIIAAGELL